jgi:hypothetical protein
LRRTGTNYKNLFSDKQLKGTSKALGVEAFTLLPTDLYALRNCAEALSVNNRIQPWLNSTLAVDAKLPTEIAAYVGRWARDALQFVLEHMEFHREYGIPLESNWFMGTIPASITLRIPESTRNMILSSFERTIKKLAEIHFQDGVKLVDSLAEDILTKAISTITSLFPDMAQVLPLPRILSDLLRQLIP